MSALQKQGLRFDHAAELGHVPAGEIGVRPDSNRHGELHEQEVPETVPGDDQIRNVITIKLDSPPARWVSVRDVIVVAWGIAVLATLVALLGRG